MIEPTLLDYTPTQSEEIERLTKLAAEKNTRAELLLADPVFIEAASNAKAIDKKIKEILKSRDEVKKILGELRVINRPTLAEPTEDGYYILTTSSFGYGRSTQVSTSKALLLKALGEWFDLSEGESTVARYSGASETFDEFIDIDDRTVELTITRLEDVSKWPSELLETVEAEVDEVADAEDEGEEDEDA